MKYLIIFFIFMCLSKTTAQQANFSMSFGKGIDSLLTYLERDSLKRGLVPFTLNQLFEKQQRDYLHKRDSILKKLDGSPVPDFEARDTAGLVHRPANYRGRVVLLHFWRFWDYSFLNEVPRLNEMIEKHGLPEGYEHLDILTFKGVLKYANAEKNSFTIAREMDWKEEIIDYEITALPQTLTDLVKKYWGEKITLSVKPIRSNGEILEYKLIETNVNK